MKERPLLGLLSLTFVILSIVLFAACQKDGEVVPEGSIKSDIIAPEPPRNLTATHITDSSAVVSWQEAKDNIEVVDYVLYRDSVEVFRDTLTSYHATDLKPATPYKFSVRAADAAGNLSEFSKHVEVVTKAADSLPDDGINIDSLNRYSVLVLAPVLVLDSVTTTAVSLSWKSETNASAITEYRVYQDSVKLVSLNKKKYTVQNLVPENSYSFWVAAVDVSGKESKPSNAIDVLTLAEEAIVQDTVAPPAPVGLSANAITSNTVDLSWRFPTDSIQVSGYSVYRDSVLLTTVKEAFFQVGDLEPETGYSFTVTAWDDSENESLPSEALMVTTEPVENQNEEQVDSIPLSAPINLRALEITDSTVSLAWDRPNDSTVVQEYLVYQNGTLLGNTAEPGFMAVDLAAATEYTYTVSVLNDRGQESVKSAALAVITEKEAELPENNQPPAIPTELSVSDITTTSIRLNWKADSDSDQEHRFKVFQNDILIGNTTASAYEVNGLSPNTEYSFSVSAIDGEGNESARSTSIAATTEAEDRIEEDVEAPTVPTGLLADGVSETAIELSWTPSTDNVGVAGYRVFMGGELAATVEGLRYNVSNLAPGTEYSFAVSSFDAVGNESRQSVALSVSTAEEVVVDNTPPTAPRNLGAQEVSQTTVDLVWEAATDDYGVVGYRLYQNGGYLAESSSTYYRVSGLDPATTYRYAVSAIDAEGNESEQSREVSVITEEEIKEETSDKILVFTKTAGFRHGSIEKGVSTLQDLGRANDFEVVQTENASDFNADNLAKYKVVVFLNTTGDVLDYGQQVAFENYIRSGGSFMGVHAATDTEYDWPWYGQLVGAYFNGHPSIQEATLNVVDHNHSSTAHLPGTWTRTDEWYNFKDVYSGIVPLVLLDESSYSGGTNGEYHPFSWYHEFDGGRAFYTAGGHSNSAYDEAGFKQHLLGGLMYCLER
ncbi:fibronectin type III domain-containing protein [Pseudozobellia thermophila]|uniref:Fibronectin type III domain-containing protein n=1 Tax=Pseudozobellia thermophila TaxID=192903 RepID=A0A1M6BZ90_9FLAO|nr:ThuA domain-containing protein [Pseudozobellia thermophila]SHI53768.1 Fibronectin type III domain-containing protein [Pseudozobellia thermophila]